MHIPEGPKDPRKSGSRYSKYLSITADHERTAVARAVGTARKADVHEVDAVPLEKLRAPDGVLIERIARVDHDVAPLQMFYIPPLPHAEQKFVYALTCRDHKPYHARRFQFRDQLLRRVRGSNSFLNLLHGVPRAVGRHDAPSLCAQLPRHVRPHFAEAKDTRSPSAGRRYPCRARRCRLPPPPPRPPPDCPERNAGAVPHPSATRRGSDQ